MTINELLEAIADKAAEVRRAQRAYFRTRGDAELAASKAAERELDELLRRREAERRQPSLFGDES